MSGSAIQRVIDEGRDQRRGAGNPAPATTYIILSRSGAGYLGSYGRGSILGIVVGAAFVYTVLDVLLLLRAPGNYFEVFIGAIAIIAGSAEHADHRTSLDPPAVCRGSRRPI